MKKRILCAALLGALFVPFLTAIGEEDLFQGCRSGNLNKVMLAVASGADIRAVDAEDNTALHMAAVSKDVLEYLIGKGAVVDTRNRAGYTPFLLAVRGGSWSAGQLLLDKGANLLAETSRGESALLLAALTHEKAMVQFIRSRRFPPDMRSRYDGATALHHAARRGDADAVSLLLDVGEDANALDSASSTALDAALEAGSADCAALLRPRTAERKTVAPAGRRPSEMQQAPIVQQPSEKPQAPRQPTVTAGPADAQAMARDPAAWTARCIDVTAYDIAAQLKERLTIAGPSHTIACVDGDQATPLLFIRVSAVAESYDHDWFYVAEDGGLYRFGMPDYKPVLLASRAGDVAAGRGDKVWFTDADGSLSSWDNGATVLHPAVKATRISVGPDGRVWFVTPEGRIGIFSEPGSVQSLPGNARDIAVGREGTAWIAAADGSVARWDGGQWLAASVDLAAARIAALADGTPCLVTADNRIALLERVPEKPKVVEKPRITETMARDPTTWFVHRIDAIAYDIAAQLKAGLTIAGPTHTINVIDGSGQATPLIPVHVSAVAESYDHAWFYVAEDGGLYRFGLPDFKQTLLASGVGDVAAGPGNKVWFTDADGSLSSWDNGATVLHPAVKATRISVGPDGRVWFVAPDGRIGIFTEPALVRSLPGYALDIAVGQNGAAWKVAADGSAARWDGERWLDASADLAASRITVLADGTPYFVTADNRVAWIDGTPGTKAAETAVSSGTGIFHGDGEVRRIRAAAAGKSLKIVVMGDGYVTEDLEAEGEYDKETRRLADAVIDLPPFHYFRDRIDVYVVYVESRERGADTTPDANDRDTALGASFYSDGLEQRVLTVRDRDAMERYARKALPSRDLLLVSVNDRRYGGTGSALVAVGSRDPESIGLMMHEIGHSFAALGDEYGWVGKDDPKPASDALRYPNLDIAGDPAKVRWSDLIGRPKFEKVGVFEGGFYRNEGVFRPQEQCLMRFHNMTDRYCAVCEEAMYRKLCSLLDIPYGRDEFLRVYEP